MFKALFIAHDPRFADVKSPVRARMQAYAKEIGELHILTRGKRAAVINEGALTVHVVPVSKLFAPLALSFRARKLIRKHGIAVVSAQDPFEHGWAAYHAVRGTQTALHIQVHTDFLSPWFTRVSVPRAPSVPMPFLNRIRRMLADFVLPRADGIRAVSRRVQSGLIERYGKQIPTPSILPVANIGEQPASVALPEHPFSFAFITVSRLEPEKRIEDILVALKRVIAYYPVGLFIVGDGSSRDHLMRLARSLSLEDNVIFLGWRTDAWALMQSAQCYIQASAYEGYGLALLEAALARVPIITTDVGIVGEVFRGYEEVLSAPPGDPAALTLHMAGLINDHMVRQALVRNAEVAAKAHIKTLEDQPSRIAEDLHYAIHMRTRKP